MDKTVLLLLQAWEYHFPVTVHQASRTVCSEKFITEIIFKHMQLINLISLQLIHIQYTIFKIFLYNLKMC